MARRLISSDRVFLDTAYAVALASATDEFHPQASGLAAELESSSIGLLTYREPPDKEWGLTDRVSFVVMQAREIADALTTDEHFQQAGFRALLREPRL